MTGRAHAAVVGLVALAVHARCVAFGFTNLDDRDLVVDDRDFLVGGGVVRAAFGRSYMHVVDASHAYYRPLVTLSYAADARTGGHYHATNVVLYATASVLFLALLRRFALPPAIATMAALVFAVHPALAEAVAWIPGRNDALLAVFALGAWIAFEWERAAPCAPGWRRRGAHGALFVMALFTKETAVVLPVVWAASAWLVRGAERETGSKLTILSGSSRIPARIGYDVVLWAVAIAAFFALRHAVGAAPSAGALDLAGALPLLVAMLGKIVFPVHPTVLGVPEDIAVWPGFVALIGIAGATLALRSGARVRKGVVAVGLIAFAALLAPVLATRGTLVLDSRLVLPACGVLLALAELLRAATFGGAAPVQPRLVVALSAIGVVVLAALTAGYEASFRDRRTFARAAVADAPHSALAHFCMGQSAQLDGDDDRALAEYAESLALGPGEVVHNNVAVLHMKHARWSDAERELREELAVNPRYGRAYANLAIVLRHEGREGDATEAEAEAAAAGAEVDAVDSGHTRGGGGP